MLSFVLPTFGRGETLARTLRDLGRLSPPRFERIGGGEVVVVDNKGDAEVPGVLPNGFAVRLIREPENIGAAARNTGARAAQGEWLVMLDDDSAPQDSGLVDAVLDTADDTAAIGAEIYLPGSRYCGGPMAGRPMHEAGGLPEVFVGCGALIRREAFLEAGGYDPRFGYYVEEYDLCARLILDGWRITHDRRFRVDHHKVEAGRDMNRIVRLLVRNGGWVAARYAPQSRRDEAVRRVIDRCRLIAEREHAQPGFTQGVAELDHTIEHQPRRAMSEAIDDRFTGLAAAREAVRHHADAGHLEHRAHLMFPGKHASCIERALSEAGVEVVADNASAGATARMIGTLSPGPVLDGLALCAAAGEPALSPLLGFD